MTIDFAGQDDVDAIGDVKRCGQSDVGGKVAQQLVRVIRAIIIGGGDTGHAQRATAKFAFVALGCETLS